jgi:hypothetical protein
MLLRLRTSLVAALLCLAGAPGMAADAARPMAVVELFTSQGCSACPPADRVLSDLARDPTLLALSLSIDYWDYLGWRDTLASAAHSTRQKSYARTRGDRQVYTPQMVVNGVVQVQGSDRMAVDGVLAEARRAPLMAVSARSDNGRILIEVPAGEAGGGADIWICAVSRSVPVEIGRGENKGHTLTYSNVVRRWVRIGRFTGEATSLAVPWSDIETDGSDAVAVLVQQGGEKPSRILGAAFLPR